MEPTCTCTDCRGYGCDDDCLWCNAPAWFTDAVQAGAIVTDAGPTIYGVESSDRHRYLTSDDVMGEEVCAGGIVGGKGSVFYTNDEAVSWLLNGPGPRE